MPHPKKKPYRAKLLRSGVTNCFSRPIDKSSVADLTFSLGSDYKTSSDESMSSVNIESDAESEDEESSRTALKLLYEVFYPQIVQKNIKRIENTKVIISLRGSNCVLFTFAEA